MLSRATDEASGQSSAPLHAEAEQQLGLLLEVLGSAVREARSSGRLNPDTLRSAMRPLVSHLLGDPDTLLWLLATRFHPAFLYRRAVGCALLMGVFARHLGFGRRTLEELMLGALLMDIGKISVPVPILAKPGKLTPIEMGYIYRHVHRGLVLTALSGPVSPQIIAIVGSHHERLDGSGYPSGTRGTAIPLAARMAAIVDTYDAMTLNRAYAPGLAPPQALRALDRLRESWLDSDLVREFTAALGAWPTGSLVQLDQGQYGVIREQAPDDPRHPIVQLLAPRASGVPSPPLRQLVRVGENHRIIAELGPAIA